MATRHRIDNALSNIPMGDVEKYFTELSNIIETNSGTHDFKVISHDCNNTAVPVHGGQFTRFRLTDQAMDIVDISKGYVMMKLEMDINFEMNTDSMTNPTDFLVNTERPWYFVGFKSASHIIEIYNVYSNGVLTACKQTKARHEQTITYLSKAKEERVGRPGMYTTHEKVREMSECVCGAYVQAPPYAERNKTQTITFDVLIQIDDLLPFSAFEYFPRFLVGDLELELSASLYQNMVWCAIPYDSLLFESGLKSGTSSDTEGVLENLITSAHDSRFFQCGDYAFVLSPYVREEMSKRSSTVYMTIKPSNLVIREAKSYIHGFNIKDTAKQNIANMFAGKNLVIPAQWIDHYTFSQLPTTNSIRTNIQTSLFNACQVIMTFPNSANQLTVSRNPHLESIQCQISDRIIPDKFFSTLDKAHAEMILANLNMDSLFSAPDELIEALTKERHATRGERIKKDDSDYMLVFNLERFGKGCFCDGLTDNPVPINFQANFMYGTQNPHYYYQSSTLHQHNVNLFIVSDAFWVCNREGCRFVKDVATDF